MPEACTQEGRNEKPRLTTGLLEALRWLLEGEPYPMSEPKSKPTRVRDTLSLRDEDDLKAYCERLRSLAIHACGMEPASTGGEPPTTPGWMTSYTRNSDTALARGIAMRLEESSRVFLPAAHVLMALHDPAAVLLDGKNALTEEELDRARRDPTFRVIERLSVGRRLAVYPMTALAADARRWADTELERKACAGMASGLAVASGVKRKGGRATAEPLGRAAELMALRGRRATDVLSLLADAKTNARGDQAAFWRDVDDEARVLISWSICAWNVTAPHRVEAGTPRPITGRIGRAA